MTTLTGELQELRRQAAEAERRLQAVTQRRDENISVASDCRSRLNTLLLESVSSSSGACQSRIIESLGPADLAAWVCTAPHWRTYWGGAR